MMMRRRKRRGYFSWLANAVAGTVAIALLAIVLMACWAPAYIGGSMRESWEPVHRVRYLPPMRPARVPPVVRTMPRPVLKRLPATQPLHTQTTKPTHGSTRSSKPATVPTSRPAIR